MADRYNKSGGSDTLYQFPAEFEFPAEQYFKDADPARAIFGSLVGIGWFSMITEEVVNSVGDTPNIRKFNQLAQQVRRRSRSDVLDYLITDAYISNIVVETPVWIISSPGETNGIIDISWTGNNISTSFLHYEIELTGVNVTYNSINTTTSTNTSFNNLAAGNYKAIIKIIYNNGSKSTGIRVNITVPTHTVTPPDPVANLEADGISETQIRVRWTKPINSDLKHVVVSADIAGTTSDPADQTILASATQQATFTVPRSSSVTFTATAYDNADEASTAETVTGAPLAALPPPNVAGLTTQTVSATSIRVTWDAVAVSGRTVRYLIRSDVSGSIYQTLSATSVTYASLTANQPYSFTVHTYYPDVLPSSATTDQLIYQEYQNNPAQFSTGTSVTHSISAAQVTNLGASGISETQIRVSWVAPTAASHSYVTVAADVAGTNTDPPTQTVISTAVQRADFTVPLNSTVTFTVISYTSNNVVSVPLTITASPTAARTPNAVTNASVNRATATTAVLTWMDNTTIPIDGIRITNTTDDPDTTDDVAVGVQTFTDTGLVDGTGYSYNIQSYRITAAGRIYSQSRTVTVANTARDVTPPAEVTNLRVVTRSNVEDIGATLSVRGPRRNYVITWTDPADADFDAVILEFSAVSSQANPNFDFSSIETITRVVDEGVQRFQGFLVELPLDARDFDTVYQITAKARDDEGNVSAGVSIFNIPPPAPTLDASSVRHVSFFPGNLAISWEEVDFNFAGVRITYQNKTWNVNRGTNNIWITGLLTTAAKSDLVIRGIASNGDLGPAVTRNRASNGDLNANFVVRNADFTQTPGTNNYTLTSFPTSSDDEYSRLNYDFDDAVSGISMNPSGTSSSTTLNINSAYSSQIKSIIPGRRMHVYNSKTLERISALAGSLISSGSSFTIRINFSLSMQFLNDNHDNLIFVFTNTVVTTNPQPDPVPPLSVSVSVSRTPVANVWRNPNTGITRVYFIEEDTGIYTEFIRVSVWSVVWSASASGGVPPYRFSPGSSGRFNTSISDSTVSVTVTDSAGNSASGSGSG